jgi:hypothetical protein
MGCIRIVNRTMFYVWPRAVALGIAGKRVASTLLGFVQLGITLWYALCPLPFALCPLPFAHRPSPIARTLFWISGILIQGQAGEQPIERATRMFLPL